MEDKVMKKNFKGMIDYVLNSEGRSKIATERLIHEMERESLKFMGGKK